MFRELLKHYFKSISFHNLLYISECICYCSHLFIKLCNFSAELFKGFLSQDFFKAVSGQNVIWTSLHKKMNSLG